MFEIIPHLLSSCAKQGIKEFVITSGGRNACIADGIRKFLPESKIYTYFEERSAGFFALGRTINLNLPCAVVVTSGTAVAELFPSVIEAFHQRKPLVIISADHPKLAAESGVHQAINQKNLFGDFVSHFFDLEDSPLHLFGEWDKNSPIHINIRLEEAWDFQQTKSFSSTSISSNFSQIKQDSLECFQEFLSSAKNELLVFLGGISPEDREEVFAFLNKLNAPVICDATSGLRKELSSLCLLDSDYSLRSRMPKFILRIGDVPISSSWNLLENSSDVQIFVLDPKGWKGLNRKVFLEKSPISSFLSQIPSFSSRKPSFWLEIEANRRKQMENLLLKYPWSEAAIFRRISEKFYEHIYLGNSLPIREWNTFASLKLSFPFVDANRGANGIDGQISTWLGISAKMKNSCGIFGDLTTLYDLSSFGWFSQVEREGKNVVVINNQGGKIFSRLERFQKNGILDYIENSHSLCFKSIAEFWKIDYHLIRKGSKSFDFPKTQNPLLIEICPDKEETEKFLSEFS